MATCAALDIIDQYLLEFGKTIIFFFLTFGINILFNYFFVQHI